jgi:hypothetical protein
MSLDDIEGEYGAALEAIVVHGLDAKGLESEIVALVRKRAAAKREKAAKGEQLPLGGKKG